MGIADAAGPAESGRGNQIEESEGILKEDLVGLCCEGFKNV